MKKMLCLVFAVVICLSAFSGCSNQQTRNTVELTNENLYKYIEISYDKDLVLADSDESLKCTISGVLDYAFYDNVVITFDVNYRSPDVTETKSYEVYITLNAAGDAEFEIPYHGLTLIINHKGQARDSGNLAELLTFTRFIRLKSISGKIIYSI